MATYENGQLFLVAKIYAVHAENEEHAINIIDYLQEYWDGISELENVVDLYTLNHVHKVNLINNGRMHMPDINDLLKDSDWDSIEDSIYGFSDEDWIQEEHNNDIE